MGICVERSGPLGWAPPGINPAPSTVADGACPAPKGAGAFAPKWRALPPGGLLEPPPHMGGPPGAAGLSCGQRGRLVLFGPALYGGGAAPAPLRLAACHVYGKSVQIRTK